MSMARSGESSFSSMSCCRMSVACLACPTADGIEMSSIWGVSSMRSSITIFEGKRRLLSLRKKAALLYESCRVGA